MASFNATAKREKDKRQEFSKLHLPLSPISHLRKKHDLEGINLVTFRNYLQT